MAVPSDVSIASVEAELPAAREVATRAGWKLAFNPETLTLEIGCEHPRTNQSLLLHADFKGYRAIPPAWRFLHHATRQNLRSAWPEGGVVGDKSSIFHSNALICAPFNRLAYAAEDPNGPHSDWGPASAWLGLTDTTIVRAANLGEMLQLIRIHLKASPGMLM